MLELRKKINSTHFVTDGGLETDLIFNKKIDLPHFAAFTLVDSPEHQKVLGDYYKSYMEIAKKHHAGFILESPTWRANPDWAFKLGYSHEELIKVNEKAISQLKSLREGYNKDIDTILISGQIGPRGDGYQVSETMTEKEAKEYHSIQIKAFKNAGVDLVTGITMTYTDEALGIINAAKVFDLPVVISFTLETDGKLPSGETLEDAILKLDRLTKNYPFYYMVNCAHPSHFIETIKNDSPWKARIKGVRANASCKSHAELDEATELDVGNKEELANYHVLLREYLPELTIFGGCCGTDDSHVAIICDHILN